MKLTEHFTLEELIYSKTAEEAGIDNTPDFESAARLAVLACNVLEPARIAYGGPIIIGSGYRCPALNAHPMIRGTKNSQHLFGEAADLQCADLPLLFATLKGMDVDQLLYEHNSKGAQWIHVSYKANGQNRHQVIDNYKART